jgi:PTS system N-acetylgalactosamine-specific IIB component
VIALVRVDNRLLHGQVLEAWMPKLGATSVVVADDEAALSPLARAAMTLCVPCEIPARVERLAEVDFAGLAESEAVVLLLVRDVAGLIEATKRGLTPARAPLLNLGNVHFAVGRRPVTPSVFLTAGELESLKGLAAAGYVVEARAVPTEAPLGLEELERRYAAAR